MLLHRFRVAHKVGGFLFIFSITAMYVHATPPKKYVSPFVNDTYDESIKKWAEVYTPQHPWYWNKAQLIAESGLNPNAVSSVGAMGLGQFMPKTWEQMERELGFYGSPFDVEYNIQASAYYMSTLIKQFKRPRPYEDVWKLSLASYNAGLGNILKAQSIGGNHLTYSPMALSLHKVTGKANSKQTTDYVTRIGQYIIIMEGLEQ